MVTHKRLVLAALGDEPPTEFRIFKAGVNESTKGDVLFDEQAAASVMKAYLEYGVDLVVDLEHASLDYGAFVTRADASDARGWFRPEVRNGELWAIGVTWTADGARRIRERTQRYISPAFNVDDENRVTELVNCALVAMPATLGALPLVASVAYPAHKLAVAKRAAKYLESVKSQKKR